MGQAGFGQGGATLRATVALDVLDQHEEVGLLVEEGVEDRRRDGSRPGLVADVEGGDPHGEHDAKARCLLALIAPEQLRAAPDRTDQQRWGR